MSEPLDQIDSWDVPNVAAAVAGPGGSVIASRGAVDRQFRLASISKLLAAYAILIAVEEEAVSLDDPAGPPAVRDRGATLAHLLAHTSGMGLEATDPVTSAPGVRRIYSNAGIEAAADHLAAASGIDFETYLAEAVLEPLGMVSAQLRESPAHAVYATVTDLIAFAGEVFAPRLLSPQGAASAVQVQFPGLAGFVPGVGRFDPCDWGFGFERNFGRVQVSGGPHWAGTRVSTATVGHFGAAGTFFWLDPQAQLACVALTDRPFDAWAMQAWPALSDAVVERYSAAG